MDLHSCYPADIAKRQAITWRHTIQKQCPTCEGPMLVGYLDEVPSFYVCHRCEPQAVDVDGKGKCASTSTSTSDR
jgi:hypothetical protein